MMLADHDADGGRREGLMDNADDHHRQYIHGDIAILNHSVAESFCARTSAREDPERNHPLFIIHNHHPPSASLPSSIEIIIMSHDIIDIIGNPCWKTGQEQEK